MGLSAQERATRDAMRALGLKRCGQCGYTRALTMFYRDTRPDRREPYSYACRLCESAKWRERAKTPAEKTRYEQRKAAGYFVRAVDAWCRANPDRAKANRRKASRKRQALKRMVPHAPYDGEALLSLPCYLCGAPADAIEHVWPLAMWWDPRTADAAYNVLPVCTSCNSRKNDADPLAHWAALGFRPFDNVVFADPREWAEDPDYAEIYSVS